MSFGKLIRDRRLELGIGLNDMAGRAKISPAFLSRMERGLEPPPRDEVIERFAAILGLILDDVFVEAKRFPPDMQNDVARVVSVYRKHRSRSDKSE
ncbi:MAG: transcriptional regulator [Hyphomicrobium sp. 32-62-53]|nr:MAG: transcriptional regulator [Hyphomicrobium sp. 12-62-95]OYY01349.1 MAG: transcriptional regulator [Hyphomicrobium sp. 32-62-53]